MDFGKPKGMNLESLCAVLDDLFDSSVEALNLKKKGYISRARMGDAFRLNKKGVQSVVNRVPARSKMCGQQFQPPFLVSQKHIPPKSRS